MSLFAALDAQVGPFWLFQKSKGDHAFAIRAPRLWNDLPEETRLTETVISFKPLLKTHFYRLTSMLFHLFIVFLLILLFLFVFIHNSFCLAFVWPYCLAFSC